jgi:phospholipase/carboxylesterase
VRPVTLNGGMRMRAWYDIKGLNRSAGDDEAGFKDSDAKVRELIARQLELGIPSKRIVLAGFSQGGAVSLYALPRLAQTLAGVMALSCYLPLEQTLQAERLPADGHGPWVARHLACGGVCGRMARLPDDARRVSR